MNGQHPDFPEFMDGLDMPALRFRGAGHRRTHVGRIIEEVACGLLGLRRAKAGNQGVFSPDAYSMRGSLPVEIKSVHVSRAGSGKSVLYDFRLEKERVHAPRLAYVFVCRTTPPGGGKARDVAEFLDRLRDNPLKLALVPGWVVREAALRDCKLCKAPVSRKPKGKRPGYADGYRNLQVKHFLETFVMEETRTFACWGRTYQAQVLYYLENPWTPAPDRFFLT